MKQMGTSILVTCLSDAVGAHLAEEMSSLLGLFYASCKDIVEYDLFDSKAILKNCGLRYLKQREKSALKSVSQYEGAVIYVDYQLFKSGSVAFKNVHPCIYLRLPKQKLEKNDALNKIAFETRDK